ncbi:MAG: protein component of RNase [Gammaproteobacteria bacterium]|jgi:ribonuclease P protein component|nr:protein component of RNase [Gammaproteobacteria bacterium]
MNYTFPISLRLKTPAEFKRVWSEGRRLSGQYVAVTNCKNSLGYPRLGLSLSKKQIRRAVDRNRIKRLARETFRHIQSELKGTDLIIIAYKGMDKLPPKEQYQCFKVLWKRLANIYSKQS